MHVTRQSRFRFHNSISVLLATIAPRFLVPKTSTRSIVVADIELDTDRGKVPESVKPSGEIFNRLPRMTNNTLASQT